MWTRWGLSFLPVQMVTARENSSSEMALSASVYMRMAIWEDSREVACDDLSEVAF